MSLTVDNVDDIEAHMKLDVEENFHADIDALINVERDDLPDVVVVAQEKYLRLLRLAYKGKNKWRTGAWAVIESKLQDERHFIYDLSDITAVCTYALYIEVAVLYLRDGTKRAHYDELNAIVSEDVQRLGAFITTDHANSVPEGDQDLIFYAMTMCRLYLQRLKKEYPDTH